MSAWDEVLRLGFFSISMKWLSLNGGCYFSHNLAVAEMDPHLRFNRCIFRWVPQMLKLCGHNFITEPFRIKVSTAFLYGIACIGIYAQIYTIMTRDISSKLFCTVSILLTIQVKLVKLSFKCRNV